MGWSSLESGPEHLVRPHLHPVSDDWESLPQRAWLWTGTVSVCVCLQTSLYNEGSTTTGTSVSFWNHTNFAYLHMAPSAGGGDAVTCNPHVWELCIKTTAVDHLQFLMLFCEHKQLQQYRVCVSCVCVSQEHHPGDSKNYNECIRHETIRVAVCDMLEGKVSCPEALWWDLKTELNWLLFRFFFFVLLQQGAVPKNPLQLGIN